MEDALPEDLDMTTIVHRTPGLLDIRAVTVMGLSVKPRSDNPIGMFGTGLKYAIATLCRMGCTPVLWIGRDKHTFIGRKAEFRGADYVKLRMRLERPTWAKPRYVDLPFTTEYGRFWQPWMAYRELETNTRDEGGETLIVGAGESSRVSHRHVNRVLGSHDSVGGADGETRFVITHPDYAMAHLLQHETFLPGGRSSLDGGGPPFQALPGESPRLYWRGMRVMDLAKPSVRTWNMLLPMELTEDRTLKHEHVARGRLARWLAMECMDAALIEEVITADGNHWEHRLDFEYWCQRPSPLFMDVYQRVKARTHGLTGYVSRYLPLPAGKTVWERHPRPWTIVDELYVADATGIIVMARPPEPPTDWLDLAEAMVRKVNGQSDTEIP
jgi:hypothetical protein